tara:strand:- start:10999 stop:12129 length:1131 start_codon:yes stop_codon:yes gene_type:complete
MKYKCNENGQEFVGSSYTTECPECGSTDIELVKSNNFFDKIKEKTKKNKFISLMVVVIIILLLIGPCGEEEKDTKIKKEKYSLEFNTKNNDYCLIYLISEEGEKIPYSSTTYAFLNLKASIEEENGDVYSLQIEGNKIFYCTEGEVTIEYNTKSNDNYQSLDSKYNGIRNIPEVKPINKDKNCIANIELGTPSYDFANCQIIVPVVQGGSNAFISINGKEGNFKNTTKFSVKGINDDNFEIWYYPKGFSDQKVKYDFVNKQELLDEIKNNKSLKKSKINIEAVKSEVKSAIKLFNDKSNRDLAEDRIYDLAEKYPLFKNIFIDGEAVSVWVFRSEIQALQDTDNQIFNFNAAQVKVTEISMGCGSSVKIEAFVNRK